MKFEFRLLNDILAKKVMIKAGSFDAVTHERFLMMSAIHGGVKVNWGRLLFNIFKDMVTPTSKQAQGFAVQICILLKGAPDLDLGEANEFPTLKILTAKTVGTYVAKNKNITVDVDEPAEPVVKKAAPKRRLAPAVGEPVAKKKRTTALSVIPRGSWGDVARRFTMIRWANRSDQIVDRSYDQATVIGMNRMLTKESCYRSWTRLGDLPPPTFEVPEFPVNLVGARRLDASKKELKKSAVHDKHISSILFISLQLPTANYLHSMKTSEPKAQQKLLGVNLERGSVTGCLQRLYSPNSSSGTFLKRKKGRHEAETGIEGHDS
ncbi:glutamate--glyoxylate aminotransferase 2-like [Dorcoceras hygrometricum]|uniref:Glutamate--glyoxylate aminotransferase 2-like n=1 Tax=Dorcoceras hygrometricum TaxID=472368 RepID=A0A2Z7BZ10_9LAMI|nr:glutamate--glyoxylate aminotransferase 2-like [Dorcoceras hygrometricum]